MRRREQPKAEMKTDREREREGGKGTDKGVKASVANIEAQLCVDEYRHWEIPSLTPYTIESHWDNGEVHENVGVYIWKTSFVQGTQRLSFLTLKWCYNVIIFIFVLFSIVTLVIIILIVNLDCHYDYLPALQSTFFIVVFFHYIIPVDEKW